MKNYASTSGVYLHTRQASPKASDKRCL